MEATRWRIGIGAGVAVWLVLFGPFFWTQRQHPPSWIPRTTPAIFADTVGRLLQDDPRLMNLWIILLACGGAALAARHPALFRVWLCLFAAPTVVAAIIGIWTPFFQARVLAVCSWGAVVALAALVDAAASRLPAAGILAAAAIALLLLPATRRELAAPPTNSTAALDYIRANARNGDVIAIRPRFLLTITRWYLSERRPGAEVTVDIDVPDTDAFELGDGPRTGRVWLMENLEHRDPPPTQPLCAPPYVEDGHRVWCLLTPPSG